MMNMFLEVKSLLKLWISEVDQEVTNCEGQYHPKDYLKYHNTSGQLRLFHWPKLDEKEVEKSQIVHVSIRVFDI